MGSEGAGGPGERRANEASGADRVTTAEQASTTGQASAAEDVTQLRTISDVETLRALADPLRLSILTVLMTDGPDMRVMSVKELAEELSEPQTKLYRHIKQLEATGLIRVAASRLVSGIVEHRYQASQRDILLGPELLNSPQAAEESVAFVTTALNRYRDQFAVAYQAFAGSPSGPAGSRPILHMNETRVSAAKAAEIRARLSAVIDEVRDQEDPDGVPISMLVGFLVSPEQDRPGHSQPGQDQPG